MTTTSSTTSTTSTSTTSAANTLKTQSLVTLLGGGSGIDMAALANNLATAQFEYRTQTLTDKQDKLNTQISTASNLKSLLLNLDTSLGTLVRSGGLSPTPSVANSSVASATLSGSTTPSGTYSLQVTQLASAQRVASNAYSASTDTVGSGTLTLNFGSISGGTFTQDASKSSVDITIAAGATLADVATAINGANAGVTAYVTNTTSGAQLVLKGAEGANNAFTLSATEDAADPGLSNLAWAPGSTNGTLLTSAQDANYTVDGLSYTSTTNTVTDTIPGVKLQLTGTNTGSPTTVSFADTTDAVSSSMQDLTDALNQVMDALNSATSTGGDLVTDAGARALKQSLSQLAGKTVMPNATGVAKTLADLGLSTQRDGTFSLDTTRLQATIAADPKGVAAMFTNGLYGVYATIDSVYRSAASTTSYNSLGSSIASYNKQLTQVTTDISDVATQQEALRARLASQFTHSETQISAFKATQSMLTNQIAAWNSSSS